MRLYLCGEFKTCDFVMKKIFLIVMISASLFSCSKSETKVNEQGSTESVPECCRNKSAEILFPSEAAAKLDSLAGKEIMVRGFVKKVCHCSGKKCQLADNDESETALMIMAGEEIGKFDQSLTGKNVKYTCVVKENRITKEMIAESEAKMAEEAAQEEQKSEKKSCCSSDSTAKSEEKEHGHCGKKKQNFEEMKAWMQDHGKDYYPVFFLEAKSFEVME